MVDIQPIERQSIAEEVAARLRSLILQGELPAGSRLPAERELAERFGTNRNTLREALRTLEAQGLVTIRQGAASEVLDFRESGNFMLIPFYLQEVGFSEQLAELIEDLYATRRSFLTLMAEQAAQAAGETDKQFLWEATLKLADLKETKSILAADIEFYRALIKATGSLVNRWLFNTFIPIYHLLIDQAPEGWSFPKKYFSGIEKITRAVAGNNAKAAGKAIKEHLTLMDKLVSDFLKQISEAEKESP